MKFISESKEHASVLAVGGKGSHLQKLISWGAPVPPFFVITTDAFRYYQQEKTVPKEIEERFHSFLINHSKIALRSSMISEDNIDSSFAGMFETLLDVNIKNWKTSLIHIFDSVNSPRVTEYIQKKNLKVDLQMAVVAQELIEVDKSGVLFSRSPVAPTAAIAIDAGFGMGEGVVSGHTDVDHYKLTRTKELIESRVNNKEQVLTDKEMHQLADLAINLEKISGSPSDIEWGYQNGKLFLFQIRPITRAFEPLTYYVDTNLSESYPGVVSPFTAAFIKKAYENVFKESALIMGAKADRFEMLSYHYARLISCVDDHLYYNLEHYYAVLRALPGGEKNIDNWHKMIGGEIKGTEIPYHKTELSTIETVQVIFALIKIGFSKKKTYANFLTDLDVMKTDIETKIKNLKTADETIHYLNWLINRPIGFGLTVVNDVFIMMGLGILTKALKKKGIKEDLIIDLLKTTEGVDSTKPLEHFNCMVQNLSSEFIEAFVSTETDAGFDPYVEIFRNLKLSYKNEVEQLDGFLKLYGDRSFEELKLESLPLKNNPVLLKELIGWAKKNPSLTSTHAKNTAEIKLSVLEKKVLSFTREAISMREATRLWRGKFYHLIRQLVLNMADQLKREDPSWRNFKISDFFSLSPSEWQAFKEGKLPNVQDVMKDRRPWQTKKRQYPEVIPWVESESLPAMDKVNTTGAIEGQGVSPGMTEGVALVLENPQDALNSDYKDFILVTKNTDPAWVYIMSRSLGLISEKGSLLSHTAIIGRELNIPTIVGVRMATHKIKSGDRLRMDAGKGTIEIL